MDDVLAFIGNVVVLEIRMPLAEPTNDQAVIGGPDVKPRQHLPATTLECRLQVPRTLDDLDGVATQPCVLGAWLSEWLRRGDRSAEGGRSNCYREQRAERADLLSGGYATAGIRKGAVERMTAR